MKDLRKELSDSFELMRKVEDLPEEAFISKGYWPHDEILEWCIRILKQDEFVNLAKLDRTRGEL